MDSSRTDTMQTAHRTYGSFVSLLGQLVRRVMLMLLLLLLLAMASSVVAVAHEGPVDPDGCHKDGDGRRHCH